MPERVLRQELMRVRDSTPELARVCLVRSDLRRRAQTALLGQMPRAQSDQDSMPQWVRWPG
jgi:hypothetical protein